MENIIGEQKSSKKSYKSFMAAFLSPTIPKKPPRRKSINFVQNRQVESQEESTKPMEHSNDSIYSTIEDMEALSHISCQSMSETGPLLGVLKKEETTTSEPVYASIYKKDKQILLQRIRELSEENRLLKKQTHVYLKEEKVKEETVHAKLQLEIAQLEAQTRKEVKFLSDKIKILNEERSTLNEQIDLLQGEKKELCLKNEALTEKTKSMISPQVHKNMTTEYQKLLNASKENRQEEIRKWEHSLETAEKEKNSLETQVQDQKETLVTLTEKLADLESDSHKLKMENAELRGNVEELQHNEHDNQKLILSLLKVTEGIAVERDVLLNRASFQENQQKELQNSVVHYTLNIGRLQEHISNLSQENIGQLLNMHTKTYHQQDEERQKLYSQQLDILRGKTLDQNTIINDLESKKKKLEKQLEDKWGHFLGEMKSIM